MAMEVEKFDASLHGDTSKSYKTDSHTGEYSCYEKAQSKKCPSLAWNSPLVGLIGSLIPDKFLKQFSDKS